MRTDTIHVIGAGLGGLAAAAIVARSGHPVVVHDSRARPGGRGTTDDRDGFRFNQGPHALYVGGATLTLLGDLGIRVPSSAPNAAGIGLAGETVSSLPVSPRTLLSTRLVGPRGKAQLGKLFVTIGRLDPADHATTTVRQWVDDTCSDDRAAAMLHTLVRLGTYVNDPDRLSADCAIRLLQLGTTTPVAYVHGGWQTIVDALVAVPGISFAEPAPIAELPDGAATIVAVGSPQAAGAIVGHSWDVGPMADASCLDLGLRGAPPVDFALGIDRHTYFSNHSVADGFAPAGHSHVAIAEYLAPGVEPARTRLEDFARAVGVLDDDIVTARYMHRMTVSSAIPTADFGGEAGRPGVQVPGQDGVFVVGDWVGPDGHLADAVFASARVAATAALSHTQHRPVVS